jgi:beta-xylosidase
LGDGQTVFDQPQKHPTCEGPKFHKWNGWYYISAPAGGVATGWQLILRSRNVYGPYEEKIVLEQGSTSDVNGPHQGAIVDSPDGQWWFLHFQEQQPYGRIVHLQPMRWENDWPVMGEDRDGNGIGEPVDVWRKPAGASEVVVPETSDEFDSPALGLQWQWHANAGEGWYSLHARPGWLRLFAQPGQDDLYLLPHALLQKLPAPAFSVETAVETTGGAQAALAVIGNESGAMIVQGSTLTLQINGKTSHATALPAPAARLRITMATGGLCRFAYATGEKFIELEPTFQATEGKWIGAKVGLFCNGTGHADFDYLRFGGPTTA